MQLEADPKETASVRHHAKACSREFQALSTIEETREIGPDEEDAFWATRQFADFNLWCAKVGVQSEGHRSIEVRLKDVPEICELLLGLLQSLHRDLNQLRQHYVGLNIQSVLVDDIEDDVSESSSISFDSLSSSDNSSPENKTKPEAPERKLELELKRHISDTTDRLQAQAMRIERAGAEHRRRRVEAYREKDRPKQMYDGFKRLGLWKANEQFERASEIIRGRMAESLARRRIRFEYLSNHQKKRVIDMGSIPEKAQESVITNEKAKEEAVVVPKQHSTKLPTNPNFCYPHDQKTIFSATVNTQYNFLPGPKIKERAESVRSIALPHTGFPPPPQIHHGRFQCPYCLLDFREAEAGQDRWKQHVMQDFEPYFCTFEKCKAPFEVPNSFEGLLDHLQSHLPVRYHLDEPEGEHREYIEADFERRVNTHCKVSDEVMAALKETSRKKGAFLFENCPFCGGYPDDLEKRFPDRDTVDAQRELRKHIKQHMQEIALFLPPYRSDIFDDDNDDQKASGVTHRRSNQDVIPENPDDFVTVCSQTKCDCKDSSKDSREPATADEIPVQNESLSKNLHETKYRWICCQCGRDYRDMISNSSCIPCENHEKCQSCLSYEYDSSHDVDWQPLIQDSAIYNRTEVTNMEFLGDDRLHSFIMRYAVGGTEPDNHHLSSWRFSRKCAELLHLFKGYIESQPQTQDKSWPFRPQGGIAVISHLLELLKAWSTLPTTSKDEEALLAAARNGDLSTVRGSLLFDYQSDEVNIEDIRCANEESLPTEVTEGDRTPAFYRDVPIWIEWKFYDLHPALNYPPVEDNVKDLARMLKEINLKNQTIFPEVPLYRVPRYLGYFYDEEDSRFGLIFENLRSMDAGERPTSLRDLLARGTTSLPTLNHRIELVKILIETFQTMHAAGYLHRGICSNNVLFSNGSEMDITGPYISGFDIAPYPSYETLLPLGDRVFTIYRHPLFQAKGGISTFHPIHDMYSLGLVLLEIAYWKPINEIMEIDIERASQVQLFGVRNKLLSDGEPRIIHNAGLSLGGKVAVFIQACIEGIPAGSGENLADSSFSTQSVSLSSIKSPQEQLAEIFNASRPREVFEQSEVEMVAKLLQECSEPAYKNPRTYIILRTADSLDKLERLLDSGFNDHELPVTMHHLPKFLDSETGISILRQQQLVMSAPQYLEMGLHCHFSTGAPAPIEILESFGAGGISDVQKIRSIITSKTYALKKITRGVSGHRRQILDDFLSEIRIMRRLRHIHIIELVGSYTDETTLGCLMNPVADCSLGDLLEQDDLESSSKFKLRSYFGCLATAVAYIHGQGIRHNGLKPRDVLIHQNNVFIIDFDISLDFSQLNSDITYGPKAFASRYAAPETIAQELQNSSIDIWALGCIFLEMAAAIQGYCSRGVEDYFKKHGTEKWRYYENATAIESLLRDLSSEDMVDRAPWVWIKRMLQQQWRDRPTAAEVFQMILGDDLLKVSPVFFGPCCARRGLSSDGTSTPQSEKSDQGRERTLRTVLEDHSTVTADQNDRTQKLLSIPEPYRWDFEASSPVSTTSPSISKVIQCNECLTEFRGEYRKGNLARHIRQKHRGSKLFQCEDKNCSATFMRADTLLMHYRRHHPYLYEKGGVSGGQASTPIYRNEVICHRCGIHGHLVRDCTVPESHVEELPESSQSMLAERVPSPGTAPPIPKGILKNPTTKFPEDPSPIREGVAPHKSSLKGKSIPPSSRWTKIDRRLVNPEALEEARERFEERKDCVIVLRILTKQDVQRLADRTMDIRKFRKSTADESKHPHTSFNPFEEAEPAHSRLVDGPHATRRLERIYGLDYPLPRSQTMHEKRSYYNLDDGDFSYIDPASMYRDTEPVFRGPRGGSPDNPHGSQSRGNQFQQNTRRLRRDPGPPPSTRGFDKIDGEMRQAGETTGALDNIATDRRGDDGAGAMTEEIGSHLSPLTQTRPMQFSLKHEDASIRALSPEAQNRSPTDTSSLQDRMRSESTTVVPIPDPFMSSENTSHYIAEKSFQPSAAEASNQTTPSWSNFLKSGFNNPKTEATTSEPSSDPTVLVGEPERSSDAASPHPPATNAPPLSPSPEAPDEKPPFRVGQHVAAEGMTDVWE